MVTSADTVYTRLPTLDRPSSGTHWRGGECRLNTTPWPPNLLPSSRVVVFADLGFHPRYGMLETIREYARERLVESGDASARLDANAAWCLELVSELRSEFRGPRQHEVYDRLEVEHDNLRAALEWTIWTTAGAETALRIAGGLAMFWNTRGHTAEGLDWTEAALAVDASASDEARDDALYGLSLLAHSIGDYRRARSAIEACVELRKAMGEPSAIARALNYRAVVAGLRESAVSCLSSREIVAAEARGRALTLDAALELALGRSV